MSLWELLVTQLGMGGALLAAGIFLMRWLVLRHIPRVEKGRDDAVKALIASLVSNLQERRVDAAAALLAQAERYRDSLDRLEKSWREAVDRICAGQEQLLRKAEEIEARLAGLLGKQKA